MHATAMFTSARHPGRTFRPLRSEALPAGDRRPAAEVSDAHGLHLRYLQALAEALARAERAEQLLHHRLIERAWPTALSGLVGGFLTIVGLRMAGL